MTTRETKQYSVGGKVYTLVLNQLADNSWKCEAYDPWYQRVADVPHMTPSEMASWETERRAFAAADLLQRGFAICNFSVDSIFGHCQQITVVHGVGADFKFSRSTALVEIVNAAALDILEALLATPTDPTHRDRLFEGFPA